jgi:hypothetical protein
MEQPRRRGLVDRRVRWVHVIRRIQVGLGELEGVGAGASAAWCCVQNLCCFFGDGQCFNLELFPIRLLLFRGGNLGSTLV